MRRSKLRAVLIAQAAVGVAVAASLSFAWWMRAHGLELGDLSNEMKRPPEPRYAWISVDKLHWQVVSTSPIEDLATIDAREGDAAGCAAGMVRVKGGLRQGDVEWLQDAACTDWISRDFPARCRTFDAERLAASIAPLPQKPLDFCMDRYEYPNQLGQNPIIVVTFHEAEAMCGKAKKRLCTESEWTLACEGEEARPYPYGYTRDPSACVVDRNWRPFAEGALQPRDGQQAREELDRLWQAEPSGSRGGCKSPFGVYDMTGNVDEWTSSVRATGYRSVLKGGYWGPVRARCRPSTRAHDEDFVAYQQGFRCCADSNASVPAPAPNVAVAHAVDASAPPADTHASVDDLAPPRSAPFEEQDELAAIKRTRVGFACAASPGLPSEGSAFALVFFALVRRRRAER